jgi:glycosyltransferase involved in cell wall biosynthesis
MIHTLHVISGLGTGGAEAMLVQVTSALQRRGLVQHVVSLKPGPHNADLMRRNGVAVEELGLEGPLAFPRALWTLRRIVERTRPEVIQGWMYHGNVMSALGHLLTTGRGGRRLWWNLRASNVDFERYGRIVRLNALLSSLPDLIVANSGAGATFHLQHGFRPRRMEILPNGIDTERFKPDSAVRAKLRAQLGISADRPLAIHVARVDPMKDHGAFISAMGQLPDVAGLMVGAGTEQFELPPNVQALGLRLDIPQLYACADIVVSTSAFAEGFSNVIAEGMSAGLVPVATDVGDARLIVGEVGQIVEPRSPAQLVDAIRAVAGLPLPDLRDQGLRARRRIVENFTLAQAVETFSKLHSDCVAGFSRHAASKA